MRSFWTEPFLWIHLAGLAAVPLTLELVWLGLAFGNPLLPIGLELLIVAAIGIVPVLGMQLTRPFDIFSLLFLALKPECLSNEQQRLLSLFKRRTSKFWAIAAAALMAWVLWQIYQVAPMAAGVVPLASGWRLAGLLGAGLAFLFSNLFLQVPLSVVQVLFTSEAEWATTKPYPLEKTPKDFTIPGLRVNRILPVTIQPESDNVITAASSESSSEPM